MDYEDTFALVAKMNTVRILLSLAVNFDWELQQYDGELEKENYMSILLGFSGSDGNKVCRLKKTLYGLKWSPRALFGRQTKLGRSYTFHKTFNFWGSHNINCVCG